MKNSRSLSRHPLFTRLVCAATGFFPSLLLAHPGHYHPDETDEFDFLSATFVHSHGAIDFVLIGLVLAGIGVATFGGKPVFRLGALAVGLGSLSLLPLF